MLTVFQMRKFASVLYENPTWMGFLVCSSFYIASHNQNGTCNSRKVKTERSRRSYCDVISSSHVCALPKSLENVLQSIFTVCLFSQHRILKKRRNQLARPFHVLFHFTKKTKNNCWQKATCVIYCPLRFVIVVSDEVFLLFFLFDSAGVVCFFRVKFEFNEADVKVEVTTICTKWKMNQHDVNEQFSSFAAIIEHIVYMYNKITWNSVSHISRTDHTHHSSVKAKPTVQFVFEQ